MSTAQVRQEAEIHGLEWVSTDDSLPRQHLIIFRRKVNSMEKADSTPAKK
jgi:hypothetical protein